MKLIVLSVGLLVSSPYCLWQNGIPLHWHLFLFCIGKNKNKDDLVYDFEVLTFYINWTSWPQTGLHDQAEMTANNQYRTNSLS
jgi:hypothetical protein